VGVQVPMTSQCERAVSALTEACCYGGIAEARACRRSQPARDGVSLRAFDCSASREHDSGTCACVSNIVTRHSPSSSVLGWQEAPVAPPGGATKTLAAVVQQNDSLVAQCRRLRIENELLQQKASLLEKRVVSLKRGTPVDDSEPPSRAAQTSGPAAASRDAASVRRRPPSASTDRSLAFAPGRSSSVSRLRLLRRKSEAAIRECPPGLGVDARLDATDDRTAVMFTRTGATSSR
jgi:hypothetical protein